MSTIEGVLAAGDMPFQQIVDLVEPLIPAKAKKTEFGYSYDGGLWAITDATWADDWYEDDFGVPFSKYRFDIMSSAYGAREWAQQVFELLSEHTNLDLLLVTEMDEVHAHRPTLVAA